MVDKKKENSSSDGSETEDEESVPLDSDEEVRKKKLPITKIHTYLFQTSTYVLSYTMIICKKMLFRFPILATRGSSSRLIKTRTKYSYDAQRFFETENEQY